MEFVDEPTKIFFIITFLLDFSLKLRAQECTVGRGAYKTKILPYHFY